MKIIKKILFILLLLTFNNSNVYAQKTIDEGTYIIKSKLNNNKVFEIDETSNELKLEQINNQKWIIKYESDGYYRIIESNTNKLLEVANEEYKNNTHIVIADNSNKDNQKWIINKDNGYFKIMTINESFCLDIPESKTDNGTNINIYKCNNGNNQRFKFAEVINGEKTIDDGTYIINNEAKNMVLDVYDNQTKNKTNVSLYKLNNGNNQKWIIKYIGNGYYTINTKLTNLKCLDANSAKINDKDNIQIYDCNNTNAQKWIIKDIGNGNYNLITAGDHLYAEDINNNIEISYKNGLASQIFKFNKVETNNIADSTYIIKSYLDNNKVFDLPWGSTNDNTNVTLYNNKEGNNQKWILNYQKDGYYTISSQINKNKVIQVENKTFKNLQKITLGTFNNNENQKWELNYNSDGSFNIKSIYGNYCLDIPESNTTNGTGIILYSCNKGNNQKFKFAEVINGEKTIEDGTYTINISNNSNKVLDVYDNQTKNKTNVTLYNSNNGNNQKWDITYNEGGYYTIKTKLNKNKCLDENGGNTNSGDNVQIYDCNNTNAQKWLIKDIGNGEYNIISAKDHMYLNMENNENINIYYKSNSDNQKYKFTKLENKTIDTDIYTIKLSSNTNKVLDVHGASDIENTNVELYSNNNGNNQKWFIFKNNNGYYTIKSGLNSNLYLSNTNNNILITKKETLWEIIYADNNNFYIKLKDNNLYLNTDNDNIILSNNRQKFTLEKTKINDKARTVSNGNYIINTKLDTNKVLDVHGNNRINGTNIELYQNNNGNNQAWKLTYKSDGYYTITSLLNTNTSLDLQTNNNNIQLYKYNGTDAQLWRLVDDGNGSISIVSKKNNNLCISVKGSKTDNTTNIEANTCNNTNNQKFILTKDNKKRTYKGIDVSQYQANINWEKTSNNIDFAIIRLGYGDNWTSQDDKKFDRNVEECEKYNIPYAFYIYSYAKNIDGKTALNTDSESAASEAEHALRLLKRIKDKGYNPSMKTPIYIDMEEETTTYLGKDRLTKISDKFCTILNNNGYGCGIYANKSWLSNYLDAKYLNSKYQIWIAEWGIRSNSYSTALNSKPTYNTTDYKLWQFSAEGRIPGISGDVDMDIGYNIFD